jgi:LysR family glycine cleavage system transcriptional activator
MRPSLPPLDALEAFEAAARHESFAKAATELHLSASAVSHRIKALEAHLGQRMFHRLAQGVRLTDRGRAYLPVVRDLFDGLAIETAAIFGGAPAGRVAVRAPVSYAALFLAARLDDFVAASGVHVDVLSAIWEGDTMDVEIDIEIRLSPPPRHGGEAIGPETAIVVRNLGPASGTPQLIRVVGYEDWTARLDSAFEFEPGSIAVDTWQAAIENVATNPTACALVPSVIASAPILRGVVTPAHVPPVAMRSTYWIATPNPSVMQRPEVFALVAWLRAAHEQISSGPPAP